MIQWIAKDRHRFPSKLRQLLKWIAGGYAPAALVIVVGCSAHYTIEDVNRPYGVIRASVKESLPMGTRQVSENGREYDSNYFPAKGPIDADGKTAALRQYAHVEILGAGRPYKITIKVITEKRSGGSYDEVSTDSRRASEIAKRINTGLANRRDDRNMIDDFKPF